MDHDTVMMITVLILLSRKMVRQLREVLDRHSTNEIDTEQVMSVITSQEPKPTISTTTPKRMGPKSQFSSAFLGTGVTLDEWEQTSQTTTEKKVYAFGLGRKNHHDFLKMIGEEKNILDLKRVRNDITTQIRKKRAQIGMKRWRDETY